MSEKPTYEELKQQVEKLTRAKSEWEQMRQDVVWNKMFLETVIDKSPFAMWVSDNKGTVIRANRFLCETVNVPSDKIIGKYNVLSDQNLKKQGVMPAVRSVFNDHRSVCFTIPWKVSDAGDVDVEDGRNLFIKVSMFPILDHKGKLANVVCQWVDITEQKRDETSLKAIEWLLKSSPADTYLPQRSYGDLTTLNTQRTILDNTTPPVLADIAKGYMELLETSVAIYERNGDYAHAMFTCKWCRILNGASRKLCGTDDNATALSSGKWLCHESCWGNAGKASIQTGKPVDVSCHGGIRIYSFPIWANQQIIGAINFGYGDPPQNRRQIDQIARKYRIDPMRLLTEAKAYESRPKFIIELAKKRLERSAKLIGAIVESKSAKIELQQERERLKVTLQSIGDGVITTDTQAFVILINKVAEKLTGWNCKEAKGKKLDEIFHTINVNTRLRCDPLVTKILNSNSVVGPANDKILVARDGTERIILDSGAPIVDTGAKTVGVVLVFRDITERIRLESELRHAQKMEAIGNIAGGIAHEFNNVLGIIIGNAELAIDDLEKKHPILENLKEIKLASLRAKDVVKQLLTFSHKMEVKRKPVDSRIIVLETLTLLRAAIPSSIQIRKRLPAKINPIIADSTQIHQVLINLCNNAAQAMSERGGILTIKADNINVDGKTAHYPPDLLPGRYVRFSVGDTGHGIEQHIQNRIFDPYFTTKEVGKGIGMGLAVVHGIVRAHQGVVDIKSRVGRGTTFDVYLPCCEEEILLDKNNRTELPTGNERILLVDDEPAIMKLCTIILVQLGYDVVSDTDPTQTLKRFKKDPWGYDLVISDMVMPDLTGDSLAQKILKIRPDMPIVICTGFSDEITQAMDQRLGIKNILIKPIEKYDLAKTVRQVLDEAKEYQYING